MLVSPTKLCGFFLSYLPKFHIQDISHKIWSWASPGVSECWNYILAWQQISRCERTTAPLCLGHGLQFTTVLLPPDPLPSLVTYMALEAYGFAILAVESLPALIFWCPVWLLIRKTEFSLPAPWNFCRGPTYMLVYTQRLYIGFVESFCMKHKKNKSNIETTIPYQSRHSRSFKITAT